MDTMRRNMIFEANKKKIDRIIRRNAPLLIALRLEPEDVYQELAIAALQAIESFDPMRSESLEAHIWMQLQYAILTIKRRYKHHGITAMERPYPVMLSVELAEDLGCPFPAQQRDDVPACAQRRLQRALDSLEPQERKVVVMYLDGNRPSRKAQCSCLNTAFDKLREFYGVQAVFG